MNFKITLSFVLLLLVTTSSFAVGFPVERHAVETTTSAIADEDDASTLELTSPAAAAMDSQMTALLLWIFLWPFAAHRWYLKSPIGWNILFILTFGGLGIWAIVDLIDLITGNYPGL